MIDWTKIRQADHRKWSDLVISQFEATLACCFTVNKRQVWEALAAGRRLLEKGLQR